jgi:hypothetical protein
VRPAAGSGGSQALRALAGRVERLASIRELIDATMPG